MTSKSAAAIILLSAVSVVSGQEIGEREHPRSLPTDYCNYDRTHAIIMRVKESHLDLSLSSMDKVHFPVGTIVSVNRRQQSWSCVTGSVQTPEGWKARTGWMESSYLEPIPRSK
jgi:hypothetical protein